MIKKLMQIFMFLLLIMLSLIANVLFGAASGWFIGLFFGSTISEILAQIGIEGFSMWQIGAFLGFISGFLKGSINFNEKRKG